MFKYSPAASEYICGSVKQLATFILHAFKNKKCHLQIQGQECSYVGSSNHAIHLIKQVVQAYRTMVVWPDQTVDN